MKCLMCMLLLLLECFVFSVQQQVDEGLAENEIGQLSSEDRRQSPPQTDPLRAESQQYCHLSFSDIHAALRELTASVTEQKANIRALETQLREELNKKTDDISNLTQTQLEELRKENRDREIAFSAALMESGNSGVVGPFTTDITLTYRNVFSNIGNAYNPTTGVFTAPLRGAYMFRISAFGSTAQSVSSTVAMIKNGEHVVIAHDNQPGQDANSSNGVVLILEVGDVVYARLWSGRGIYDDNNNHNTFSGFLLFPLR